MNCLGVCASDLEAILALPALSPLFDKVIIFAEPKTTLSEWVLSLHVSCTIAYLPHREPEDPEKNIGFEAILAQDVYQQFVKPYNITHIYSTDNLTSTLNNLCERHKIQFLSCDYRQKCVYENKISFDTFLGQYAISKPPSQVYFHGCTISVPGEKLVLQKADSWGSEGTVILPRETIAAWSADNNVSEDRLLRTFISGKPYGITLFITDEIIALSVIRLQCFYENLLLKTELFKGLQWVPTKEFTQKAYRKLNEVFTNLASVLYEAGYFGYANIDFILNNDEVYIIECNARTSAASFQLSLYPELISGVPHQELLVKQHKSGSRNKSPRILPIPSTEFTGSLMYIDVCVGKEDTEVCVKEMHALGLYEVTKNIIKHTDSNDILALKFTEGFIYHTSAETGDVYKKTTTVQTIVSNIPLFTYEGKLTKIGEKIDREFRYS